MKARQASDDAKTLRRGLVAGILAGMAMTAAAASMLTTKDGLTVYTFDKDTAGKSACKDTCAATWRPVTPDMMGGRMGAITRDDGSKQAAINGKPLYLFAGDHQPGDKAGDGVLGVWHVVSGSAQSGSGMSSSGSSGY